MDAYIAKGQLEAQNIPVIIIDWNIALTDPGMLFAVGGVKITVPSSLVKSAYKLLQESAAIDSTECRNCFSNDTSLKRTRSAILFSILVTFFAVAPFIVKQKTIKCSQCGYTTNYKNA